MSYYKGYFIFFTAVNILMKWEYKHWPALAYSIYIYVIVIFSCVNSVHYFRW